MTFLLILVLATVAAAGCSKMRSGTVRWRHAAQHGLGFAFVVAGVSHLVNATPFEQHLPSWVPAATTIIVVSGLAEIALGFALVAARRSAPVVGLVAAGFLISVFPANAYVAVAGVDVDGLPGGLYAWLRLPLQGVFIVWAWASTRDAHDPAELGPSRLPPTWNDAARRINTEDQPARPPDTRWLSAVNTPSPASTNPTSGTTELGRSAAPGPAFEGRPDR